MNFSTFRKEYADSISKTYFPEISKTFTCIKANKKTKLKEKKYISILWENLCFKLTCIYNTRKFFIKTNQIYNLRYFKLSIINIIQPGKNYSNTYTI